MSTAPPRILCLGSVNIDDVYYVHDIARPGETVHARGFFSNAGANQAVALAKAGAVTLAAGKIGLDGSWILDKMAAAGVNTSRVLVDPQAKTGRAMIQVSEDGHEQGENSIVLFAGANRLLVESDVDHALDGVTSLDWLVMQNETNCGGYALRAAKRLGMTTLWNAAPMTRDVLDEYPMDCIDVLVVNAIEAADLLHLASPHSESRTSEGLIKALSARFPSIRLTIVTLGSQGSLACIDDTTVHVPSMHVPRERVLDSTGAGDTFIGYLVACLSRSGWKSGETETALTAVQRAMVWASTAAALSVQSHGAMDSIPVSATVEAAT